VKIQFSIATAMLFICCYPGVKVAGQTPGNERKAYVIPISAGYVSTATPLTKQNEFNWHGKIAAGGLGEIVTVSGDIRIEIVEEGEVEIVALKQGDEKEFDRVRIQVKESAGGVKICAAYLVLEEPGKYECPVTEGSKSMEIDGDRQLRLGYENGKTQTFQLADVRVQFKARMPREARLSARTLRGNVEAEWLTKGAPARTVSTGGGADRGTTNSFGAIALSSLEGNVRLTLPHAINARVRLGTVSGAIATDFPVTVPGGFRGKGVDGHLGQDGPKITLNTMSGNVELRRAQ
jgi:DUF4097 and DUF4098 domain-containing protein YvlB